MPTRRTTRGADRTPLSGDCDVLVCGASFAGLAVARELRGTGARVLVLDRYDIGERPTSACAASTEFETAKVHGRAAPPLRSGDIEVVRTDRGDVSAPLVVDALGWKRFLGA